MQKFTVFSILLSLSIVLGTLDVFFHDYLSPQEDLSPPSAEDPLDPESLAPESSDANGNQDDDEPDEVLPNETNETDGTDETDETGEIPVGLQEEPIESLLSEAVFIEAGFTAPAIKSALFSGLVFQFIPVSATEAESFQWNIFDGQNYIGTVYELAYSTDTGSFSSYLDLRDRASQLTEIGTLNEVNLYGDASFYFNHTTKTKTVHMVARYGDRVFAFEYMSTAHEQMKKLFDNLKTLQ